MYETDDDLNELQALLDTSYERGGTHMRRIVDEHRLSARQLAATLTGMRLLTLATVTADGRPMTGPVDSFFYRGRFHFGSAPDSVRMRHLTARPVVSATHLPGEELCVSVHGSAEFVDVHSAENAGFKDVLVGHYGEEWAAQFLPPGTNYVRINPRRVITYAAEQGS